MRILKLSLQALKWASITIFLLICMVDDGSSEALTALLFIMPITALIGYAAHLAIERLDELCQEK